MRITELFTAQSIALDEAQQDRSQIIDRLVELHDPRQHQRQGSLQKGPV